jgi:hypothetical protein
MHWRQDVEFLNVKLSIASDVTTRLYVYSSSVRVCVFVFVEQCLAFPVLGQFDFCILVVSKHLNDSLFDFLPVTQLTVINLVLSKHCNGLCVSYGIYIHSTVSRVVSPLSPKDCYH